MADEYLQRHRKAREVMSEERVTTGSEPKRWKPEQLMHHGDVDCVEMPCCGFTYDAGHTLEDGTYSCPNCEVVESGHDEQTLCATCGKEVTTGQYVNAVHGLIWHTGCAEPPYDERTVAAVVEALRGEANRGNFYAADGLRRALNLIEERFKPSAPGGGNA